MGWFRSRSRWGSWLALLALALQLALSFGHVHIEDAAVDSDHAPALAAAHASIFPASAADPAGNESPALPYDCCPICTLIHLAGAPVPAEPPSLTLPIASSRLRANPAVEFDVTASRRAPFGARGPPLA
jgi:hypothetical protein